MRFKRIIIPVFLCLFLWGCSVPHLDRSSYFLKLRDAEKISEITDTVKEFYVNKGLTGVSVGVFIEHEVHFVNLGSTGDGGVPITENTVFELAEVSQVFTGHVFSEYITREWISDSTSMSKYYNYLKLPMWERELTEAELETLEDGADASQTKLVAPLLTELATHRSGYADEPSNLPDAENKYAEYSDLQLRKYISQAELVSQPGTVYNPNGMSMGLLGFALEAALQKDFETLVKDCIMYRCTMTATTATIDEETYNFTRALPHDENGNESHYCDYESLIGMAGFKSTTFDMLNFASVYLGRFPDRDKMLPIERQSINAAKYATQEHYSDGDVSLGYGYNLSEIDGKTVAWQQGVSAGFGAYFAICPDSGTAVVVLCNNSTDVTALGEDVLALIS